MKVKSIRTHKITASDKDILEIVGKYTKGLKENSILAVTSKIVSICEGRVIKQNGVGKEKLIKKECDWYLPSKSNKYNVALTIKNNIMVSSAGIDASNGNGFYVLWPADPQEAANKIRKYLQQKYNLKNTGVIITDSKSNLLRRGASGIAIAHSGFSALNNYMGKCDCFGYKLKMTKADVVDSLAISAVLVMGEGAEQKPMAVISDIPFVKFCRSNPSSKELSELKVKMDDDYHRLLLKSVKWKRGGCGR
ncbi:MAG: coenzyme F420-0:L-glutamate ligase [Parcubacteria group bacterium]|jgi:putative folate metabolism gamma-glutamate ligase